MYAGSKPCIVIVRLVEQLGIILFQVTAIH